MDLAESGVDFVAQYIQATATALHPAPHSSLRLSSMLLKAVADWSHFNSKILGQSAARQAS
jgi:hypothetical protein